jgi:hypothetical protein
MIAPIAEIFRFAHHDVCRSAHYVGVSRVEM